MNKVKLYFEPVDILNQLSADKAEMSERQLSFLCGLIKECKPKKMVEIGVAAGGTTAVILNCINELGLKTKVYSLDLFKNYYRYHNKKTGYLIEESKRILGTRLDHTLCIGKFAVEYVKQIGEDIDFLILDTVHSLPGELLDFLAFFPLLKQGTVVVVHDIVLNHYSSNIDGFATKVLLDIVAGEKFVDVDEDGSLSNIGAFVVNEDTKKYIENVFSALTITWKYIPDNRELEIYRENYKENYPYEMIELFDTAVELNRRTFQKRKDNKQHEFLRIYNWIDSFKEKRVYVYGCGNFGRRLYQFLSECGINLNGYIISDGQKKTENIENVYYLSEIEIDKEKDKVLIGVNDSLQEEIRAELRKREIFDYVFPDMDYIWDYLNY